MPEKISELIFNGFSAYKEEFVRLSSGASGCFIEKNWTAIRQDFKTRLNIHNEHVFETIATIKASVGDNISLHDWAHVKLDYKEKIEYRKDIELAETFFNSLTRRIFVKLEANPLYEFTEEHYYDEEEKKKIYTSFYLNGSLVKLIERILEGYAFQLPYFNIHEDAELIAGRIFRDMEKLHKGIFLLKRIDILDHHFYRNKKSYLVGRLRTTDGDVPLLISFVHTELGIVADTALLNEDDVEIVFSFTRSYFMASIKYPWPYVRFLKSIVPRKHYYEIYNSLGYNKHGKTLLYRDLNNYVFNTMEQFVTAPGVKGMVMAVFMLPGYDQVFKIIKDEFDPPKNMSRKEVMDKYRMVYEHGRMGRLADTQEFESIYFDKERFSPDLLEELLTVASSTVKLQKNKVLIKQLFTERKMRPLNLFIEENPEEICRQAIIDYGYALKDLAYANIFPGDLLLKNFGLTRFNRVIFYDYDEITMITDCNFREIPVPSSQNEVYALVPHYEIKPNDIFPEEFRTYLIPAGPLRDIFINYHPDLFEVSFWNGIKKRHLEGEFFDILPYHHSNRFRNIRI